MRFTLHILTLMLISLVSEPVVAQRFLWHRVLGTDGDMNRIVKINGMGDSLYVAGGLSGERPASGSRAPSNLRVVSSSGRLVNTIFTNYGDNCFAVAHYGGDTIIAGSWRPRGNEALIYARKLNGDTVWDHRAEDSYNGVGPTAFLVLPDRDIVAIGIGSRLDARYRTWILKLDPSGRKKWVRFISRNRADIEPQHIEYLRNGHYLISGVSESFNGSRVRALEIDTSGFIVRQMTWDPGNRDPSTVLRFACVKQMPTGEYLLAYQSQIGDLRGGIHLLDSTLTTTYWSVDSAVSPNQTTAVGCFPTINSDGEIITYIGSNFTGYIVKYTREGREIWKARIPNNPDSITYSIGYRSMCFAGDNSAMLCGKNRSTRPFFSRIDGVGLREFVIPYSPQIGNPDTLTTLVPRSPRLMPMRIAPNPVAHACRLTQIPQNGQDGLLELFDSQGRKILSLPLTAAQVQQWIDLSAVPTGIYLAKYTTQSAHFTAQLMKQ